MNPILDFFKKMFDLGSRVREHEVKLVEFQKNLRLISGGTKPDPVVELLEKFRTGIPRNDRRNRISE